MHFRKNKRITDVYFSGSFFYHNINEKKGRKTSVNKSFIKDNQNWYIPAFYTCSKGIVLDICVETNIEEFKKFSDKWNLFNDEKNQHFTAEAYRRIEQENPLEHNFHTELIRNKKLIRNKHMQHVTFIPGNTDNKEAAKLMKLYKLPESSCWSFYRISFPCYTKSKTETLAIKIIAGNEFFEAAEFTAEKDKKTEIIHPLTGSKYTLTVESISDEISDINNHSDSNMIFPKNYKLMKFTLSPELEDGKFYIRDKKNSDSPKKIKADENRFLPESSASIVIIGGADGPTVLVFGKPREEKNVHTVCSSLHFEKQTEVLWQFKFIEKTKEDKIITLKGGKDDLWQSWKDVLTDSSVSY